MSCRLSRGSMSREYRQAIGQEFLAWSIKKGLSVDATATLAGVDRSTLYLWEHGRSAPCEVRIDRIREVMARDGAPAPAPVEPVVAPAPAPVEPVATPTEPGMDPFVTEACKALGIDPEKLRVLKLIVAAVGKSL